MKQMTDAQMMKMIEHAWDKYEGDVTILESAVGALVLGRQIGWHGVRVIHSRMTYNRYEKILDVKFKEVLPPRGPESERLNGIRLIDKIGKFWQAISSGLISAKEAAQVELA